MLTTKHLLTASAGFVATIAFGVATSQAALVHTLDIVGEADGGAQFPSSSGFTVDVDADDVDATTDDSDFIVDLSGSLDSGGSYSMEVRAYENTTFDAANHDFATGDSTSINGRESHGWFPKGASRFDPGQALVFTFDLSGLPDQTHLVLTEAIGREWEKGKDPTMQVIVDETDHESTSLTNAARGDLLTITGMNISIHDGDSLVFRAPDGGGGWAANQFTLESFTIPEPAAASLIGVGGLLMLRRRSRG